MKLNKLFFILAAFVALTFAACSKESSSSFPGEGENTTLAFNIRTPQATYADPETILGDETIGTVDIAIFSGGLLETYATNVAVTPVTNQTAFVTTKAGNGKLVYILANIPATLVADLAPIKVIGTTIVAFEKSVQNVLLNEATTNGAFFMTNLKTPAGQTIHAGVADPLVENKNILTIEIGRFVARLQVASSATEVHNGLGVSIGAISNFEYKVRAIPHFSYLIGQPTVVTGKTMNFTPYYDGVKGLTITPVPGGTYDDYTNGSTDPYKPFLTAAPTTHAQVSYVFENSNVPPAKEGNTVRLTVRTVVIPSVFVDLTTGLEVVNPTPAVVATFYTFMYSNVKYISSTMPAGETWFAGLVPAPVVSTHTNGVTFYTRFLAAENLLTVANTIARNHVYKVNVTKVNGIGSNVEDGDLTDPVNPIEGNGTMLVDLQVVPWTSVNQDTEI